MPRLLYASACSRLTPSGLCGRSERPVAASAAPRPGFATAASLTTQSMPSIRRLHALTLTRSPPAAYCVTTTGRAPSSRCDTDEPGSREGKCQRPFLRTAVSSVQPCIHGVTAPRGSTTASRVPPSTPTAVQFRCVRFR